MQIIDAVRALHKAKGGRPTTSIFSQDNMTVPTLAKVLFPEKVSADTQPWEWFLQISPFALVGPFTIQLHGHPCVPIFSLTSSVLKPSNCL